MPLNNFALGLWEWAHAALGLTAALIFLFQTFGGADDADGDGADIDAGMDVSAFSAYLSVRNFVAFFMGYGWVTLAALLSETPRLTASLLGICAGLILVFISLYLIKTFLRFQEDGTLDLNSLAGKSASVYIAVPGSASGIGKVMADTKAGKKELPARTDGDALRPGTLTTILRAEDGVLWVTASKH